MKRCAQLAVCAVVLLAPGYGVAQAQWSNAARFDTESGTDCKSGAISPATGGGFHCLYLPGNGALKYRRYYANGSLSSPLALFYGTTYNTKMTQSLNGDIHIVFEDWSQGPNNVRWLKSTDAGASFSTTQMLTSINCAKHPTVAALGMGTSPEVVMTYYRSGTNCDETLWYRRYNGASWSTEAPLNSGSHSEYDCFGMARSPLDGSIYRTFDPSETTMAIRRYNGSSWESQVQIYGGQWAVRQHMAINNAGQVMLLWDENSRIKTMLYTPGSGSGPVVDLGAGGYSGSCDVCTFPGTNDFYMVVARDVGGGKYHVYGRRWSSGSWLTEESVQNNQADAFMVTPLVTADAAGNLYCVWEYWGSGKPQQWYSVKASSNPPGPKGYIAGTVRDTLGNPLAGAMVLVQNQGSTLAASNGTYSIQVATGAQTVQVSKLNYATQTIGAVNVSENSTTTLNVNLVPQPPAPVSNFVVNPGINENYLAWTTPATGFSGAVIRVSTTAYPSNPNDGQALIDLAGAPSSNMTFTHSGLVNGRTYYYSVFSYLQDASRFYNTTPVSGMATPAGPGDYDRDGDVDQSDFAQFQLCLSGPYIPQNDSTCTRMKFDADNDVDQDDAAAWQLCFSGPAIPSNPNCAN